MKYKYYSTQRPAPGAYPKPKENPVMILHNFPEKFRIAASDVEKIVGVATVGRPVSRKCVGECGGLRWTGRSTPTVDLYPAQMKLKFEIAVPETE